MKMRTHEKMTYNEVKESLKFCNSYNRLPKLLELAKVVDSSNWLRVLGEEWACCDNIGLLINELIEALQLHSNFPSVIPEMMNLDEYRALQGLPDTITIYRGCYEINKWGLCWTTNPSIAQEFITFNRYKRNGEQPLLVKAETDKHRIIAFKQGRDESEVITYMPRHILTTPL